MKKLFILLIFSSLVFAVTPFSLEGLKEVNVKVSDKQKLLPRELKQKITAKLINRLQKVGLKTKTKLYSKLVVKIKSINIGNTYALNISLFIMEDVALISDDTNIKLALTYKKDDFFDSTDIKEDIIESIDYLVTEFIDQYKEEN